MGMTFNYFIAFCLLGIVCCVNSEEWSFLSTEPSVTLQDYIANEPTDPYQVIYDMMGRVLGSTNLLNQFTLQLIEGEKTDTFISKSASLDVMQLDNNGTNIILRGSSTIALAVAFNWYLESYCNTTYDWRTFSVDIPNILPLPPKQEKKRSVPYMYYENVCTVSYSFAFFNWDDWQRNIDWMAMQGINMPLAFNGQEYIFSKTFAMFNLTTADLETFFSGPAYYAWQRMGNIQGWGGPISEEEITNQFNLQLQILARMDSFEMTPLLTCFAGHVPKQFPNYYPHADVIKSPDWASMPVNFTQVLLLNFSDPLFTQIGSKFIELQTKYFGTWHLYQCDTFNEMDPSSSNPEYLQSATRQVYNSLTMVDKNAIWVIQGWLFLSSFWNAQRVKAYLSGVPNNGMIILDLHSDGDPIYNKYDSYYGKPFIWNTLHTPSAGGRDGLGGNIPTIFNGFVQALNYKQTTVSGIGITMEGIWQNYIVFDATYKMGYETTPLHLKTFAQQYAYRRYGLPHSVDNKYNAIDITNKIVNAWNEFSSNVYISDDTGPARINGQPAFDNNNYNNNKFNIMYHKYINNDNNNYDDQHLKYSETAMQRIWKYFINTGSALASVKKFRYDLVDITREALNFKFQDLYNNFEAAYKRNNIKSVENYSNEMNQLITDLDNILLTDYGWMLGNWIQSARNQSSNVNQQNWYEFNARSLISLWGPNGQLRNYATKQWGDVIGTYYGPAWSLFFSMVIDCMKNGTPFNQGTFGQKAYDTIQYPWVYTVGGYHKNVVNDTIKVACDLYLKYNMFGDTSCV